ncbi:hypothetical protein [Staphylococcus sp. FSL K6-0099]|uniref:hypothetical protein n=1 Tax=Staphylococcus sp. FSL K6-0099 TaxID=2954603 RepID=UPI0030F85D23
MERHDFYVYSYYDNYYTVEKPTALSNSYAIYNTGTTYQPMFTLGSAYGTPSTRQVILPIQSS